MNKRTRSKRRRSQRQEGAVMLVVLLVVLTATTLAATSLQSTQFELRSSGFNRTALQTQYVSEAAAMSTLAWIDATSMDKSFETQHLATWANNPAPNMTRFGEPEILAANRARANRTMWEQQAVLMNYTMPPISYPGYTKDVVEDKIGSLGPRSPYVAGIQVDDNKLSTNYVVDLYDCRQVANTGAAGYQVNTGGSGTIRFHQWYCVMTSRGRTYVPYPATSTKRPTKTWTVRSSSGQTPYTVNRFTMAHDSRGAIITPPISE
jgi:Tfp pilus assembly protein PilX